MSEDDYRNGFASFLSDRLRGDEEKQAAILQLVDGALTSFISNGIDANFVSLYAITERQTVEDFSDKISLNKVLKAEDRNLDTSYTEVLKYYGRFLGSKHNPANAVKATPAPVPAEQDGWQEPKVETSCELHEGAEVQHLHLTTHERNVEARQQCIDHFRTLHGGRLVCECCGFDFAKAYGEIGKGFIEVHHLYPVSQRGGDYVVNPKTEMIPLCSNCHSMIHRIGGKGDCMSLKKLKDYYQGHRY